MFQNVAMTTLTTPLCNTDEISCWENRPFSAVWPENQQKSIKAQEVTKTIRKKPKRVRSAYTTEQLRVLEKTFARCRYIDAESRRQLSSTLKISDRCIKVWFQNRRMKEKRDSESSCDSSIENISNAPSPPVSVSTSFASPTNFQQNASSEMKVGSTSDIYSGQINSVTVEEQYLVPFAHLNENYAQYYEPSNNLAPSASFYYDTNTYPTYYYPNAEYYNYQYNQEYNWPEMSNTNYYCN